MPGEEKPYRVYRGGRQKGKVPLQTRSTPPSARARRRDGESYPGPGPIKQRKKWSQDVTQSSNALDLEPSVFKLRSPAAVAVSLKRSALRSRRRRASPYQSAASMLNFYITPAATVAQASSGFPASARQSEGHGNGVVQLSAWL